MLLDTYTKLAEVPDDSTNTEKAMAALWAKFCYYLNSTYTPIDREREVLHIGKKVDELYRSLMQNGREELLYAHKRFYAFVAAGATTDLTPRFLDVLCQHDLMGLISMGAPQDEYSPEVLPVLVWLMLHPECPLDELRTAIKKVFDVMFDSSAAHLDTEHYGGYDVVTQDLADVWCRWLDQKEQEEWEEEGGDAPDDVFDSRESERRDSMSISSSMSDEEFISLSEENQATASDRYRAIVDAHRAAIGDWATRTEMVKEDGWWIKKFIEPTDTKRTTHSRDAFKWLVQHYPEKLLSWIREEQLRPEDLTFAAELAGSIPVELGSQDVLVGLLQHPEALVREGAVLGLWRQEPLPENILAMLHDLAAHDSSDAVRKTVFDVLEDHEN